jgi:hypothetical protein
MAALERQLGAPLFDILETGRTVHVGFTRTQQVEVGPVDEQQIGHCDLFLAVLPEMGAILTVFFDFCAIIMVSVTLFPVRK